MKPETKSAALSYSVVAMEQGGGGVTILEAEKEYLSQEGGYSSAVPAKSIYLNATAAKRLRSFLNEVHPPELDPAQVRKYIEDVLVDGVIAGRDEPGRVNKQFWDMNVLGPLLQALRCVDPCPKCSVIKPFASTCADCGDSGVAGGLPFKLADLNNWN